MKLANQTAAAMTSTAAPGPELTIHYTPEADTISTAPPARNQKNVPLDGWKFANDIWEYEYYEKKDNTGEIKDRGIKFRGLYIQGIIDRLAALGFYQRRPPGTPGNEQNAAPYFIHAEGCIIQPVEIGHMLDVFRADSMPTCSYTVEYEGCQKTVPAEGLINTFAKQMNNIFNEKTLRLLPIHSVPILEDTATSAYFFFKNGIMEVTRDAATLTPYANITESAVWASRIIHHHYTEPTRPAPGHWERFTRNISDAKTNPARYAAFRSATGYMLHNYQSDALGKAVICYDAEITRKGKPEGGTGKGLFFQGIAHLRSTVTIDGKSFLPDSQFKWQNISLQTQAFCIDDPKSDFNFDVLFSALEAGLTVEKKHQPAFFIPHKDAPKCIISTNTALTNDGNSNKRRQFVLEFGSYYKDKQKAGNDEPIISEHGRVFFADGDGWTREDWAQFFTYQIQCVREYLADGLQSYAPDSLAKNQLIQSTNEDFYNWIEKQPFKPGNTYQKNANFVNFRDTYYGEDSNLGIRKFTEWMKTWARLEGYELEYTRSEYILKPGEK